MLKSQFLQNSNVVCNPLDVRLAMMLRWIMGALNTAYAGRQHTVTSRHIYLTVASDMCTLMPFSLCSEQGNTQTWDSCYAMWHNARHWYCSCHENFIDVTVAPQLIPNQLQWSQTGTIGQIEYSRPLCVKLPLWMAVGNLRMPGITRS